MIYSNWETLLPEEYRESISVGKLNGSSRELLVKTKLSTYKAFSVIHDEILKRKIEGVYIIKIISLRGKFAFTSIFKYNTTQHQFFLKRSSYSKRRFKYTPKCSEVPMEMGI